MTLTQEQFDKLKAKHVKALRRWANIDVTISEEFGDVPQEIRDVLKKLTTRDVKVLAKWFYFDE